MERLYEHGLSAGCLSRVHPAGRNEFRPAEMHPDFPPGLVNHPVMRAAQHDQVFDIRFAAVDPFTDMMHLAPGGCAVTPRMGATPIPRGDRPALRCARLTHRRSRPKSNGWLAPSKTTGVIPQSHNKARRSAAVPRPPKSNINPRVCSRIHW